MTVKVHPGDVAVDVGKHLGHEVFAQLTGVVAQSIRVLRIAGEKKQTEVLKSVRAQNHGASPLKATLARRIYIFGPVRVTVFIGSDPDNPAMSSQIKITGRQCFRNRRKGRIPFVPVIRAEPITPGAVSGRGTTAVRDSVNSDRYWVGMQAQFLGGLFVPFAQAEWARGRHRQRFASLNERVGFVACDPYLMLKKSVVGLELLVGDRPIGQRASFRKHRKAPPVLDVAQHLKVMRVKPSQPTAVMDDRTTHTVHHPAKGEGCFLSRFAVVPPPARYLT